MFSVKADLKKLQWATMAGYLFWLVGTIFMIIMNIFGIGWVAGLIFTAYCFMINLNIRVSRRYIK
jgi:hypothetical protein